MWRYPSPTHHVPHFRSAYHRRQFERGLMGPDDAHVLVPVLRGIDPEEIRYARAQARRRERQRAERARNRNETEEKSA